MKHKKYPKQEEIKKLFKYKNGELCRIKHKNIKMILIVLGGLSTGFLLSVLLIISTNIPGKDSKLSEISLNIQSYENDLPGIS